MTDLAALAGFPLAVVVAATEAVAAGAALREERVEMGASYSLTHRLTTVRTRLSGAPVACWPLLRRAGWVHNSFCWVVWASDDPRYRWTQEPDGTAYLECAP